MHLTRERHIPREVQRDSYFVWRCPKLMCRASEPDSLPICSSLWVPRLAMGSSAQVFVAARDRLSFMWDRKSNTSSVMAATDYMFSGSVMSIYMPKGLCGDKTNPSINLFVAIKPTHRLIYRFNSFSFDANSGMKYILCYISCPCEYVYSGYMLLMDWPEL